MTEVTADDNGFGARNPRLEEIGSAAAGIAHDINNQLTLILNHLAMPDLDSARAALRRCTTLTANLLTYCRGERLKMQPVDTVAFLHDFVDGLWLPEGIRLTIDAPEQLPLVRAHRTALTRVLTNLITNACDAMKGRGAIRITATPGVIEVTDSGPGIPYADLRSVFEPFFSTKGPRGTGLGLAIVREIMRQHGGAASAANGPGRGARFTLRFRLHRPPGPGSHQRRKDI